MGRRRRARGVGARVAAIGLAAVLACVGADAREAIARASLGANGAIEATLSQRYEGDVTYARVVVTSPRREGVGDDVPVYLTVHELGGDAGGSRCGSDALGDVYNPDDANASPATCVGRECAIGDVCGRMGAHMIGSVHGKTYAFVDRNLPLTGTRSVVGRTLAVWIGDRGDALGFSSGKVPYVCAVIEDGDSAGKVITARATLGTALGKISGVVTFRQPANDASADTGVAVRLVNRAQGETATTNYRWAIYSGSAGSLNSCAGVGEVYNPRDRGSCVEEGRTSALAEDCPVGQIFTRQKDLVSPSVAQFTDSNLPLSGSGSIVGKALVLLDEHGEKILCSDIKTVSSSGLPHLNTSRVSIGAQVGILTGILVVALAILHHIGRAHDLKMSLSSCFGMFKARSSRGFARLSEEFREIPLGNVSNPTSVFSIDDDDDRSGIVSRASSLLRGASSHRKSGEHTHSL